MVGVFSFIFKINLNHEKKNSVVSNWSQTVRSRGCQTRAVVVVLFNCGEVVYCTSCVQSTNLSCEREGEG